MTIEIREMTKDDLDNMLSEYGMLAGMLGFQTPEEFQDFQYHACEGLMRFGGSWATGLGQLLQVSDVNNAYKIIKNWRSECEEHAELHRLFIKKRDKIVK